MAGEIYIVMTGYANELWDVCLNRSLIAMGFDKPYFEAWLARDYDAYLAVAMKSASKGKTESGIRSGATLWYNRATTLTASEGDIWLHRDGDALYWSETTCDMQVLEPYEDKVMIAKPVTRWSTRNRKTVALTWNSIHPQARSYLTRQQALSRVVDEDMQAYLRALIDGDDLTEWHDRPDWIARMGAHKSIVKNASMIDMTIWRMMDSIKATVKNANGQIVLKALKEKKLRCSEEEMKAHLAQLMDKQQGICAITQLPMHLDGQEDRDIDMLASADRIDSSGHYEIGNIQLVCRFVNFWKSAQDNNRFIELLERVISHRIGP